LNKFAVVLSSIVDGATVSIQVLVNSDMSVSQLTSYYKWKSISISDVYVEALTLPELAQEGLQIAHNAI
jgi:hypothetical protein